jgi:hypothetical protein
MHNDTTTHGAQSPGIVFGPVTYGVTENNRRVAVEYRRPRASRVGARLSGSIALAASVVSAVAAVLPLIEPSPVWSVDLSAVALDPTDPDRTVMGVFLRCALALAVLALGTFVSARAWRAFRRRHRRLPKIARAWSPFRSLIPRSPESTEFVRTTVLAECSQCRDDHRHSMARVRRTRRRSGDRVYTKCALGHVRGFRENSLFYGED